MKSLFTFLFFVTLLSGCKPAVTPPAAVVKPLPEIADATPTVTENHPNGSPKKATYKHNSTGEKVADMELYQDGVPYIDRRYTKDTLNGTSYSYYENGKPWSMNNYKMGAYHGPYQLWWPNGQVRLTGQYVDGKEEGEWINFYDNGRIDTRGYYENGVKKDVWTTYNKEGKLIKEQRFE
jgi:antitoxin component YwqK of YwqJK toxin-antitoxin module